MKFGFRKPNIKKSIKARTTGRLKRSIKKSVNPFYGKNGAGWINNPKKAMYNKVYNMTTVGVSDIFHTRKRNKRKSRITNSTQKQTKNIRTLSPKEMKVCGVFFKVCSVIYGVISLLLGVVDFKYIIIGVFVTWILWKLGCKYIEGSKVNEYESITQ